MPLEPGQKLSHYHLIEKIGEGGMGVVWKARDEKLRRDVALKVLPAELVKDSERRRRLLREARSAAAINHANIAMVHEVDEAEGTVFIAMELVEGRTLRSLLGGQPLAIPEALRIAAEMAEGLAAAHQADVIHRDLKPENVLVRPDGHVKILDFGLAKIHEERKIRPSQLSQAETITKEMTREGKILGTPAYMSPEQARGASVDTRSDIFSFGVTLYEMVTGRVPFGGRSNFETLSAILHQPAVAASQRNAKVPAGLDRVLHKCLEKSPAARYQHSDELVVDLKRLGKELESGSTPSYEELQRKVGPPRRRVWAVWALAGALAIALVAVLAWQWSSWTSGGVDARTLLILPMEVRGQEEGADYVGRAFAETLAVNLAVSEELNVLPVPDAGELGGNGATARSRAAVEMGAGRLLTGALTREGDAIRASLSLLDASANRILWGTDRVAKGDEMANLATALSREVATAMGATPPRLYDDFRNVTRNPELASSPLYLEALAAARRADPPALLAATEKLLVLFPEEPDVYVLRAAARRDEAFARPVPAPKKKRLEEALADLVRVDPSTPWDAIFRAYVLVGDRWPERRDLLSRVLKREDLTPALRALVLSYRAFMGFDRGSGSRDLEEALRLAPASAQVLWMVAEDLVFTGNVDDGLARARQALALDPSYPNASWRLAQFYEHADEWEEAVDWWGKGCREQELQFFCGNYARVLHKAGREAEARAAAETAEEMEDATEGTRALARYRALAGDTTGALRLLRRHLELEPVPELLRGDGDFSSLRGNLDFEALATEQWNEAVPYYADKCVSEETQLSCALHAVALQLTGQEKEARDAAAKAASLEETETGCSMLAWYHALVRNRDEVIRYLRRYIELRGAPDPTWQLEEERDFAWLVGDLKFDAIVAELAGRRSESSRE